MTEPEQPAYRHWRPETDSDGIFWLCLDKAEAAVNTLSEEVLREFEQLLSAMEADPPRGLVIWSGKQSGFVMGADINEFTTIETADQGFELIRIGQGLFERVEKLRCPTVTVFNGFALGAAWSSPWRAPIESRWILASRLSACQKSSSDYTPDLVVPSARCESPASVRRCRSC